MAQFQTMCKWFWYYYYYQIIRLKLQQCGLSLVIVKILTVKILSDFFLKLCASLSATKLGAQGHCLFGASTSYTYLFRAISFRARLCSLQHNYNGRLPSATTVICRPLSSTTAAVGGGQGLHKKLSSGGSEKEGSSLFIFFTQFNLTTF